RTSLRRRPGNQGLGPPSQLAHWTADRGPRSGPSVASGGGGRGVVGALVAGADAYDPVVRVVKWGVLALVGLFAVIQLLPYGRDHTNPPVTQEASWPTPRARRLAVDACYDCDSNQTN